jgi:hypothetical protein
MMSIGKLRGMGLVASEVLEEHIANFIRDSRFGEIGITFLRNVSTNKSNTA